MKLLVTLAIITQDTDVNCFFVKVFNRGEEKDYNEVAVNKIKSGAKLFQPTSGLIDEVKPQNNSLPLSTDKDSKLLKTPNLLH